MYYDEIATGYEELHREEQLRKIAIVREHLPLKRRDHLLDVGCGTGFYLQEFPCDVMGVDPSKQLLARNPFPHVQGRAEELPFPDHSFDVVISITAIQNFEDPGQGLREIRRVGTGRFALSYLKRGKDAPLFDRLIRDLFPVVRVIEDDHDLIYICDEKTYNGENPGEVHDPA